MSGGALPPRGSFFLTIQIYEASKEQAEEELEQEPRQEPPQSNGLLLDEQTFQFISPRSLHSED